MIGLHFLFPINLELDERFTGNSGNGNTVINGYYGEMHIILQVLVMSADKMQRVSLHLDIGYIQAVYSFGQLMASIESNLPIRSIKSQLTGEVIRPVRPPSLNKGAWFPQPPLYKEAIYPIVKKLLPYI